MYAKPVVFSKNDFIAIVGHPTPEDNTSPQMRKPAFCICEEQRRRSAALLRKLISAFVFATEIVLSLSFVNPKFQASC